MRMRRPSFRLVFLWAAAATAVAAIGVADDRRSVTPADGAGSPSIKSQSVRKSSPRAKPADRTSATKAALPAQSSSRSAGSAGHGRGSAPAEPLRIPDAELEPTRWSELDGWSGDDHASAFATFQASCRPIVRSNAVNDERPVRAALERVCARAVKAGLPVAEAMAVAVCEGMGISVLPTYSAIQWLKSGELVWILPEYTSQPMNVYALYPSRQYLDAKIRTWVDFLREELPATLAADQAALRQFART